MKLFWFKLAREELERAEPAAKLALIATVSQLKVMPDVGRAGRVESTREIEVPGHPYLIVYRVCPSGLQVLAVHSARQNTA
jgi:hypothetical protein